MGKSEEKIKDIPGHTTLALAVLDIFNDEEWAKSIYKKAEAICNNQDEYKMLIPQVQKHTADIDFLREIHRSAENKFREAREKNRKRSALSSQSSFVSGLRYNSGRL